MSLRLGCQFCNALVICMRASTGRPTALPSVELRAFEYCPMPMCVNCRLDNARDAEVLQTSSDTEASQPAPDRRKGKRRGSEGSGEDDSAPGSEDEEGSFAEGRRQRQPTRQLPGRSSRPVSYKDDSGSGEEDDAQDDADVAGAHVSLTAA